MPRSEDEDEETGSNASDPPELTWAERFDRGVELCALHAPGWVAAAILLMWVGDGMAHWYGWYQWVEASWLGNYEYEPHR